MFDKFRKLSGFVRPQETKASSKNLALLIDGPNMLRSEFNIDLEKLKVSLSDFGKLKVCKVFLNQYASQKLIEAISNLGFEPVVSPVDADVPMAMAAVELIHNPNIDVLALMTRDSDLQPVLTKAKAYGKETLVIAADEALSVSLRNTADKVLLVDRRGFQ